MNFQRQRFARGEAVKYGGTAKRWQSECGAFRIEYRSQVYGVSVPKHERYRLFRWWGNGWNVASRHRSLVAAQRAARGRKAVNR